MNAAAALEALARHRTHEVVVTSMSVVRPWGRISDHALDFASADSAMGHTADFALGIAVARPERRVICLNGDGSMLMTLGTLVTAVESGADNYVLIVVDNGAYEITGSQDLPARGRVDWPALAMAAGFASAWSFDTVEEWEAAIPVVFQAPGPTLVRLDIDGGTEGPINRSEAEQATYLKVSLAESARVVRRALAESD